VPPLPRPPSPSASSDPSPCVAAPLYLLVVACLCWYCWWWRVRMVGFLLASSRLLATLNGTNLGKCRRLDLGGCGIAYTASEYKEDSAIVTKNASLVVRRVPATKSGGLLAKIQALNAAAAALHSNSTKYGSDDDENRRSLSMSVSPSAVSSRLGSVSNDKWSMSVLAVHRYVGLKMLDRERFLERFLLLSRRLHSWRRRGYGSFLGPASGWVIFRFSFIVVFALILYAPPPLTMSACNECREISRPFSLYCLLFTIYRATPTTYIFTPIPKSKAKILFGSRRTPELPLT